MQLISGSSLKSKTHAYIHGDTEREREREKLPFVSKKENANFACV
jgi:hypothetical protein